MLHLDPSQKRNVLFTSAGTVSEEIHCPCIAVILCTGDGAEIICGGRRISLGENDVLTVALRSGSVTGTGETVSVFLSPDAETPALPELTVAIPEIIHCGEHRGIKQLAEAIPEAFYGDPAVRDAKLHALAGLLVIRLSEYADTTPDGSTVSACAVYIRSHIDQSLTPGEIAEKLNVPEKKLRSEFAAVYGCTPAEFQRRAKNEPRNFPDEGIAGYADKGDRRRCRLQRRAVVHKNLRQIHRRLSERIPEKASAR